MTNLLPGEELLRVARQHWAVFLPTLLACVAAVVVGLLLVIHVLPTTVAGRSLNDVRLAVGLAIVLSATVVLSLRWLRWHFTTYILTSRRVVVSQGMLSRYTESIALDRIEDTAVRQGVFGRLGRAGDVEIESAGREGGELLHLIGDPVGFANELQAAVEAHRTGRHPAAPWQAGGTALPEGYTPPGGGRSAQGFGPPAGYEPPAVGGDDG